MARTVQDRNLGSRTARAKLPPSPKPYWRTIEPGLHVGYRRLKRGGGKWLARHYLGENRYEVETIAVADDNADPDGVAVLSFAQAQATARDRMVERARQGAGHIGPMTVAQAIRAYIDFLESNRKSAADARNRANLHILPELGDMEVAELTADLIHKWHVALADAPARARGREGEPVRYRRVDESDPEKQRENRRRRRSSANRTLTVLKAALNRAWRAGKVADDSAWRRVEPFASVDAARVRYLTVEESRRLLNACDPDFRLLVQAALQTGARYGELTRLQVHDFNPDAGTIAVRESKGGRPRHVVLTDEGAAFFAGLAKGRAGDETMLVHARGDAWGASHQIRRMKVACGRAKITPPVNFHALRHTWASLAVMAGVPLMIVARNLGHSDTRMVEKHYGHLAQSYIADAIRAFAPRFGVDAPNANVATMGRAS